MFCLYIKYIYKLYEYAYIYIHINTYLCMCVCVYINRLIKNKLYKIIIYILEVFVVLVLIYTDSK